MKRALLFILSFVLQNFQNINAQWVSTPGPNGGYIKSVEVFGNRILASTENGIYTSNNLGNTWTNGEMIPRPYHFASLDSVLYCAENTDVYKSIDSGQSWNSIFQLYPDYNNGYYVTDLLARDSFLFLSVADTGIFRSDNGGSSWVFMNLGIIDSSFLQMASGGDFVFLNSGYRIYRSADNGNLWDTLNVSLTPGDYFKTLKAFDSLLFASAFGKILYSKDFGQNWQVSPGDFPASTYAWDFAELGGEIFLTTLDKIFSTDEMSIFWTEIQNSISPEVLIDKLYTDGNDLFGTSFGEVGGVLLSGNNAASWEQIGLPISVTQVISRNDTLFASTFSEVYMSANGGANWRALPNTSSLLGASVIALKGSYLFGNFNYGGGINRLHYPDVTYSYCPWFGTGNVVPGYGTLSIYTDENYLYAGGIYNDVYRSGNDGASWDVIDNGLPSPALVGAFASNSQYLFVGTIDDGLYRSTDHGDSWNQVGSGLPAIPVIKSMVTNGNFLLVETAYGVYASSDNGISFWKADEGLPSFCEIYLEIKSNDHFACTCNGVYWSQNNGVSWLPINEGLPDPAYASSIAFDDSFMYIGSGGVWKRKLQDFNLSANTIDQASQVSIFPNPCSDEFYISFPGKNDLIYMTVTNELGENMVNLNLRHSKTQNVDVRIFPPGVYVIKLFSETDVETSKLVIKR